MKINIEIIKGDDGNIEVDSFPNYITLVIFIHLLWTFLVKSS